MVIGLTLLLAACGEDTSSCAGRDGDGNVTLCQPAGVVRLETPVFDVPEGDEVQDCYFFAVPGDAPVYVNRVEVAQNDGSHHMNLFRVHTVVNLDGAPGTVVHGADPGADGMAPGECWRSGNWADWPLVINSQESRAAQVNPDDPTRGGYFEWTLPQGVAHRFEPGEKLMLQTHFVNSEVGQQITTNGKGKVAINLYTVPAAEVTDELGTAFATNQSICVCPGETDKTFEATCQLSEPGDPDITIIGANGHFHSRGDRFDIFAVDAGGTKGAHPFYTSTVWDDPPMARDLDVAVPLGGGVQYACTYSAGPGECGTATQNTHAQCTGAAQPDCGCFTFGGHVENQEHCNAFIYYYPKTRDVGCF
jgi:hypothetical protein